MEVSSSVIPPQGADAFSKPVDWEPNVVVYHNRDLMVPANLRSKVAFCM